jgi:hypothetical protein
MTGSWPVCAFGLIALPAITKQSPAIEVVSSILETIIYLSYKPTNHGQISFESLFVGIRQLIFVPGATSVAF